MLDERTAQPDKGAHDLDVDTDGQRAAEHSVPPRRINEIVLGKRAITADTALRLARFFGTSERFWMNLQTRYDLERERDRLGSSLERDVEVLARAS